MDLEFLWAWGHDDSWNAVRGWCSVISCNKSNNFSHYAGRAVQTSKLMMKRKEKQNRRPMRFENKIQRSVSKTTEVYQKSSLVLTPCKNSSLRKLWRSVCCCAYRYTQALSPAHAGALITRFCVAVADDFLPTCRYQVIKGIFSDAGSEG